MDNTTVPTTTPDEANADRVACDPELENDLGSLLIRCSCKRPGVLPWLHTYTYGGTEAQVSAAFAAHRAACEART